MTSVDVPSSDFVVNQFLFWMSLIISIGAAAGIGFKVATYLRKKVNQDKNELREEIRIGLANQRTTIEKYIKEIATPAAERRDRQEFLIEQMNRRIDTIEQQQAMQLQIVLQNQQAIREFIEERKKNGGRLSS